MDSPEAQTPTYLPITPTKGSKESVYGGHEGAGSSKISISSIASLKWQIPYEEITLESELGRGEYGVVYRGKWRNIAVAGVLCSDNLISFSEKVDWDVC